MTAMASGMSQDPVLTSPILPTHSSQSKFPKHKWFLHISQESTRGFLLI